MPDPPDIDLRDLLMDERPLLLDAYGVLVDQSHALPGASHFIDALHARAKPFWILTNDASKLPDTAARGFRAKGLAIDASHIITSGSLLKNTFHLEKLTGKRCVVLGPPDAHVYVKEAGGHIVPLDDHTETEIVIVADESGYPFVASIDALLTLAARAHQKKQTLRWFLPNPDMLYPKSAGTFGLAAGSIAQLITDALRPMLNDAAPTFEALGKPHPPIFDEAKRRAKTEALIMIGDQLETDIRGAKQAGLTAYLVETGVNRRRDIQAKGPQPDGILPNLDPRTLTVLA